ncbi:MAG: hypothetical protein NT051_01250 [Candidatus Micrarchaeota archaeon]|nr:hypothetical protein [Candidatus Micrarchaeota archaeon]
MGCCMCQKVLKILAGLAFIGIGLNYLTLSPWLVLGIFMLLVGIAPFVCKCEGSCCMPGKKK